jgi:hypothetical protein
MKATSLDFLGVITEGVGLIHSNLAQREEWTIMYSGPDKLLGHR